MLTKSKELELLLSELQRLKEFGRDVEREIEKVEQDLASLNLTRKQNATLPRHLALSPEVIRKQIQELRERLLSGNEKIVSYTKECESLIEKYSNEDTSTLKSEMENIKTRWKSLEKGVNDASEYEKCLESSETPHDSAPSTMLKERRTSSYDKLTKVNLLEQIERLENKFNGINKLELELRKSEQQSDTNETNEKRAHLVKESQDLQVEISTLATQLAGSAKSSAQALDTIPNREFFKRLRQLRDKVANLQRLMQSTHSQGSLYLARLKECNDWLAHRDADFRELRGPLQGDLGTVIKLREKLMELFHQLDTHRVQIEDILCNSNEQYNAHHTQQRDSHVPCDHESDFDSENSEMNTQTDVQVVKDNCQSHTNRRIKRHLYHFKTRWIKLNNSMLDFKCQLDTLFERLSNFESLLNDATDQVKSANMVTFKWVPIEYLPTEHLKSELEQTQSFYEACVPLAHILDSLERQILQFHESQIQIDLNLRIHLTTIRTDFEQIRLVTQARIHNLHQTLNALQVLPQRPKFPTLTSTPSQRMQPLSIGASNGATQMSSSPLIDSVHLPWERCVHPTGTQVPYYKNHETQETQWDHPILCELMRSLKYANNIRFADYRIALKLRKIQKELCFDSISISIVVETLKHIGHSQPTSNSLTGQNVTDPFDCMINIPQMIDCLLQLFSQTKTTYGFESSGNSDAPLQVNTGRNENDESRNPDKYGTLPHSSAQLMSGPKSRTPSKNCIGFPRSASSSVRHQNQRRSSEEIRGRIISRTPIHEPFTKENISQNAGSLLNEDNRSSSLPICTLLNSNPNYDRDQNSSYQVVLGRKRSLIKRPTNYLIGSIKRPINVCVDLTLNWLLNVYDRMRRGCVRVLSFKVALAILSVANLYDKYRYLFSLIANRDGIVDEQRLSALLHECILIPRNLGENGLFGRGDFKQYVKSCFEQVYEISKRSETSNRTSTYGPIPTVQIAHFLTWLRLNPQVLTWLPLLHRLSLAEQIVHHCRCSVCHNQPLIGLRYRCLRCLNFDMCQNCFFSGRTARNHKLSHPMQEYCSHSTSSDSFRDFTRIVRNRFRSKERQNQDSTNGHSFRSRRSSTRLLTCKRTTEIDFNEDKPRLAPTYMLDTASDFTEYQNLDTPGLAEKSPTDANLHSQTPNIQYSPVSGPLQFTEPNIPTSYNQVSSRAASDATEVCTKQFYMDVTPVPLTASPAQHQQQTQIQPLLPLPLPPTSYSYQLPLGSTHTASGRNNVLNSYETDAFRQKLLKDDEHHLIAHYSNELRQQCDPSWGKGIQLPPSVVPPTNQTIMDRSTISDDLPFIPTPSVEQFGGPLISGHLSLDRRQGNRMFGYGQPFDYLKEQPTPLGLNSGGTPQLQPGSGRLDSVFDYYRQPKYPIPDRDKDIHQRNQVRRSYSLRARSQPSPELQESMWKPVGGEAYFSMRAPNSYQGYATQTPYCGQVQQTVRSLEDEHRALQYEYERLRQYSILQHHLSNSYGTMNSLQYMQRNPQLIGLQPAPSEYRRIPINVAGSRIKTLRSSPYRTLSSSDQFSLGPLCTGIPSGAGQNIQRNTLGRANSASNELGYLTDSYINNGREFVHPYSGHVGDISDSELVTEAQRLREHRGRLEGRMQLLEERNRQLESQLKLLRQMITTNADATPMTVKNRHDFSTGKIANPHFRSLRQRSSSGGINNVNPSVSTTKPVSSVEQDAEINHGARPNTTHQSNLNHNSTTDEIETGFSN